jgi:pyroglutamyl-peptidase
MELLKCDCERTPQLAIRLASEEDTSAVLLIGEDIRYDSPTLETTAYNWLNYGVPDNAGRQPRGQVIVPSGRAKLVSAVNWTQMIADLKILGTSVNLSNDPGRHLCNHVYFSVQHFVPRQFTILLHLPPSSGAGGRPSVKLERSTTAAREIAGLLTWKRQIYVIE